METPDPPQAPTPAPTLLEQTQKVVDALRAENDRAETIAKRNEEAAAKIMLGGGTNAGQTIPEVNPAQKMADEIVKAFR